MSEYNPFVTDIDKYVKLINGYTPSNEGQSAAGNVNPFTVSVGDYAKLINNQRKNDTYTVNTSKPSSVSSSYSEKYATGDENSNNKKMSISEFTGRIIDYAKQKAGSGEETDRALWNTKHDYDTVEEVDAAIENLKENSRSTMRPYSSDEVKWLENYGVNHGYSTSAEYDKEIERVNEELLKLNFEAAEYANKRSSDGSDGIISPDVGVVTDEDLEKSKYFSSKRDELESKKNSLEKSRQDVMFFEEYAIDPSDFEKYSRVDASKSYKNYVGHIGSDQADYDYNYINNIDDFRKYEKNPLFIKKNLNYDALTDDEIKNYNYYYNKYGKEIAGKYLDTLNLADRAGKALNKSTDSAIGKIALKGTAGYLNFGEGTARVFTNEDLEESPIQSASDYASYDLANKGSLYKVAGDLAYTAANMAPSILLSKFTAGILGKAGVSTETARKSAEIVGNVSMGAAADGNAYADAINKGYSEGQARLYGTLIGLSEGGLQYLLGGISALGGKVTGGVIAKKLAGIDNALLHAAASLGVSGLSEGIEEGLQDFLEPAISSLVLNEKYDAASAENIAYAALLGFLSAGLIEGGGRISYATKSKALGNTLTGSGTVSAIVDAGLKLDHDSVGYNVAQTVKEKLNKGEKVNPALVGRIVIEGGDTVADAVRVQEEKIRRETIDSLINEGLSRGEDTPEYMTAREVKERAESGEDVGLTEYFNILESYGKKTDVNEEKAQTALRISQAFEDMGYSRPIAFYKKARNEDGSVENGYIDSNGIIHINLLSDIFVGTTFGHELTHSIEKLGTDNQDSSYQKLTRLVSGALEREGRSFRSEAERIIETYKNAGRTLDSAMAEKEVVAEYVSEKLFSDEAAINELTRTHRSLSDRILQWINDMIRRFKGEGAEVTFLRRAQKLYRKALAEADGSTYSQKAASATEKYRQAVSEIPYLADLKIRLENGSITQEQYDDSYDSFVEANDYLRALSNAAAYAETQSGENVQSAGEDNTSISERKRTSSIIGLTAQNKSADRNYLSSKEMNTTNDVSISDNNSIFGYDENVNSKDMQNPENDTRQFSISKSFGEQVDDVLNGVHDKNFDLYVSQTPKVLINVGLPDAPLLMRNGKIKKILSKHEEMSPEKIKAIPKALESPILVLKSKTHPNESVVAITEVEAGKGKMVVPVWINRKGTYLDVDIGEQKNATVNLTASAYEGNIKSLLEYALYNDGFLYADGDIAKVEKLFAQNGLQLPTPLKLSDFDFSISSSGEKVNTKFSGNLENDTRQFSISEGDPEIIPRYGLIDKYSENGYNRNGWAYVNGILYGRATAVFLSKVASIKTGVKFIRSADGDYIIPTGHEDGINNILVYTDGNISNPSIDKVVKINFDNETNIEFIRKDIFSNERQGLPNAAEVVSITFGEEFCRVYKADDCPNYRTITEKRRSGGGDISADQGLQNGNGSDRGTETGISGSKSDITARFSISEAETQKTLPTADEEFDKMERDNAADTYSRMPEKARRYVRRSMRSLADGIGEALGLPYKAKRDFLAADAEKITAHYINTGEILNDTILREMFDKTYDRGIVISEEYYNRYKDLKDTLRSTAVKISEEDASSLRGGFSVFRQNARGKLRLSADGIPVDSFYTELAGQYSELFSA